MQLLTHKFTVEQYHQMGEINLFDPSDRLELIEGEIINMSPIGFRHAFAINYLGNWFPRQLGEKAIVSIQNPIRLNNQSEPQPDLVLLKPREDFYENQLPQAEDILLLIEVADSSLSYDRDIKIPLYAKNAINEVWLINLNQNQLEVFRYPDNNQYQKQQTLTSPQTISSLSFPELNFPLNKIFN